MATALTKQVVRTIPVGDSRYKIVMTQQGLRLTEHGKRRGIDIPWMSLIALIDSNGRQLAPSEPVSSTGVPQAIGHDVAREIREAIAALTRADEAFRSAGVLPPEVLAEIASDPFHRRPNQEPDWFIEPLLTVAELASVLRVPQASVRRLGIKSVRIAGQERYRQSIVRAYLLEQEKADDREYFAPSITPSAHGASERRMHPQARRFKSIYDRNR